MTGVSKWMIVVERWHALANVWVFEAVSGTSLSETKAMFANTPTTLRYRRVRVKSATLATTAAIAKRRQG